VFEEEGVADGMLEAEESRIVSDERGVLS